MLVKYFLMLVTSLSNLSCVQLMVPFLNQFYVQTTNQLHNYVVE